MSQPYPPSPTHADRAADERPVISIDVRDKRFGTGDRSVQVLRDIALDVAPGEFTVVIGPSGCGKSTLLRMIAGLDVDYSGSLLVDGAQVTGPSPDRGFVFQEPRLFPWLTVEKNIAAGLSLRQRETRAQVDELIRLVRLEGFETSYPSQLSGGMAQRTAIARALIRQPKVLLLDEPFSALDAFTRAHLQRALLDVWLQERRTSILVTHDLDEAVTLATRIVVLDARPGRIRTIVPVELPYPRNRTDPEFERVRFDVLGHLESAYHSTTDTGDGDA